MLFLLTGEKTEQTLNSLLFVLLVCNSTCGLASFTALLANKIIVLPAFMPFCKWIRFGGGCCVGFFLFVFGFSLVGLGVVCVLLGFFFNLFTILTVYMLTSIQTSM